MRNKLVKEIRKAVREIFPDEPYVDYTTNNKGMRLLDKTCLKKLVKDSKKIYA